MKIPENFNKIDATQFNIDNDSFAVETDYNHPGDCWVIHDGAKYYPLCFDIDWEKETYTLIKCRPGDGRHGDELATNAALIKYLMKDSNSFVNSFLKDIVSLLIKNNLI